MRGLVYIAGELTNEGKNDIMERFRYMYKAIKAGIRVMKEGYDVYIPHLFYLVEALFPDLIDYDRALERGMNILKRCDCIYMMQGWTNSSGAVKEYFVAREEELTIMFEELADKRFEDAVGYYTTLICPKKE